MVADGGNKLPYGTLPRLLLAWVCTEPAATSTPDFGIRCGGCLGATVSLIYEDARGEATLNAPIARLTEFWWSERQPDARSLWESKIELGEDFFNEIIRCPIPIDLNTLARDEAVAARPRPLPVAHLPAIRVEVPDTAHVKTALPTASTSPGARRGRSRSACVVNGRLRHTGKGAVRPAPPCVVSRVGFSVSQTSSE